MSVHQSVTDSGYYQDETHASEDYIECDKCESTIDGYSNEIFPDFHLCAKCIEASKLYTKLF